MAGSIIGMLQIIIKESCPTGWHVPSNDEWSTLVSYLGGDAGGKLKEVGTTHWQSPNVGATNESGFTGLPGGWRGDGDGKFGEIGMEGSYWSSSDTIKSFDLWYESAIGYVDYSPSRGSASDGLSVRCIKD